MHKVARSVLSLLILAAAAAPATAETIAYRAALTSADEVPPNDSGGKGSIEATYDTDTGMLTWSGDYSGLTGAAIAAHFHGPATPGVNAPPVVPVDASKSPFQGSAKITPEVASQFAGGKIYFNIHTAKNKGGEIRGQLARQ